MTPHHQPHLPGPHERGENRLTSPRVLRRVVAEVARWPPRPLIEFAAGRGDLTLPLAAMGRPLITVELDPALARQLRRRVPPDVQVVEGDMLRYRLSSTADVVANVPFSITTPWLRHLLAGCGWQRALLVVQWEVARKRAAIGGATMMTAQWWPWYDFGLLERIPAASFTPAPSVDAGLLRIERRPRPLVAPEEMAAYQALVRRLFTGRGRTVGERATRALHRPGAAAELARRGLPRRARPSQLGAEHWVALHRWASGGGQ